MKNTSPTPRGRVDVLVVGLGPVGAALTALLGKYGVRVMAVDRAAHILEHPRAIALDHEALRILQNVGLAADAFAIRPVPFVTMRSSYYGEFARIHTAGHVDAHPQLVTFYQPDLERALRAQIEQLPSVATHLSTELLRFSPTAEGVRAILRGVAGEFKVDAKYLVAADGANSEIRKHIGLDFEGQSYSEDWLIVDVCGAPDIDHVEFNCDPDRPAPRMGAPGGRQRWEFMLQPGESGEAMRTTESVRRLLAPWVDVDDVVLERSAVYRFHARVAKHFSRQAVFLVGDAAHLTPPFAGQGLVAGLRDAFNLGWKLAWVCRQWAAPAILNSYDIERRPHAQEVVTLARRLGFLIMPSTTAQARLRHGAVKWLRKTRLGTAVIDEQRGKPQHRIRDGLIVGGPRDGSIRRGAQVPQCMVETAAGQVLSDDLLGPHLTLMAAGAGTTPLLDEGLRREFEAVGGRIVYFGAPLPSAESGGGFAAARSATEPQWLRDRACVVRPDRMIMHEGPIDHAPRLVREALAVLRSGSIHQSRQGRMLSAIRRRGAMYG